MGEEPKGEAFSNSCASFTCPDGWELLQDKSIPNTLMSGCVNGETALFSDICMNQIFDVGETFAQMVEGMKDDAASNGLPITFFAIEKKKFAGQDATTQKGLQDGTMGELIVFNCNGKHHIITSAYESVDPQSAKDLLEIQESFTCI